jgi:hypothetical protein
MKAVSKKAINKQVNKMAKDNVNEKYLNKTFKHFRKQYFLRIIKKL